jgi:hypothetical protein
VRIPYFFKLCKEMVYFRWICLFGPEHDIRLVMRLEKSMEESTPFTNPIFAVAREVSGFRPMREKDIWAAAKKICLPDEFAALVLVASTSPKGLDGRTTAVREELIDRLRPKPLYTPPPNRVRAPLIS